MAFERIMSRLVGAQPANAVESDRSGPPDLRGSGSWANEWDGAERSVARAKSIALPAKSRRAAVPELVEGEHGVVEVRPLFDPRSLKTFERLADKLEAEAPTCTLHAGVAMRTFLKAARRPDGSDRLSDLTVDFLIADGAGRPLIALIQEDRSRPQRQILRVDALLDAGLPVVEMKSRGGLSAIWPDIKPHLPED